MLFVHSKLDDSGIPYHPMRVLAHLRRALGKRKCGRATGIRRMCKVCRMEGNTVEQALHWLEEKQFINIHRRHGESHEYELRINQSELYVDHRLDELKLSPVQFRVLMHIARLADESGGFFISVRNFATICGMKRETVNRALQALEDLELYTPYVERKNPMRILILDELFPKESKTVTDSVNKTSRAKTPNRMPDSPNGSGPKGLTPMPDSPNGGMPDSPNERLSLDNPIKAIQEKTIQQEDNPAFFVNSKGRPPVSSSFGADSENGQKQLTESKNEEESPDEQIERLAAKFAEFSAVNVRGIGADYKAECEANGSNWNNKVLGMRVGKAVHEHIRPRL